MRNWSNRVGTLGVQRKIPQYTEMSPEVVRPFLRSEAGGLAPLRILGCSGLSCLTDERRSQYYSGTDGPRTRGICQAATSC
jgi:hypothetical protein